MTNLPDDWMHKADLLANARVLCIGDVMLDRFVYGQVARLSPEAPIPVLKQDHVQEMAGGAGNVAANLAALGAQVMFVTVLGDDALAEELRLLTKGEFVTEAKRPTTLKTRFICGQQQMLRVDAETVNAITPATEAKLITLIRERVREANVVLLSDYAKGVLTTDVLRAVIDAAKEQDIPVIVDPKNKDFAVYSGATVVTPNTAELAEASHIPVKGDEGVAAACRELIAINRFEAVLATRGAKGMTLVTRDGEVLHTPAQAREVFDVSGAGDTTVATLAAALGAGLTLADAAHLANLAAGIAVGRLGTAQVNASDLKAALMTQELISGTHKILPVSALQARIAQWRQQGLKVGFTNGCFDLIHPGHVSLLEKARARCGKLVVAINTDASVKRLKGEARPVQHEMSRAVVLASLSAVDAVVLFDEDTPMELIEAMKPDVLVKGADYTKEQVVGGSFVESYGGEIYLAPISQGNSTTNIIKKMAGA